VLEAGAVLLFGEDLGEPLPESFPGSSKTGRGSEGMFELLAVGR
jgi:hypothetical protein